MKFTQNKKLKRWLGWIFTVIGGLICVFWLSDYFWPTPEAIAKGTNLDLVATLLCIMITGLPIIIPGISLLIASYAKPELESNVKFAAAGFDQEQINKSVSPQSGVIPDNAYIQEGNIPKPFEGTGEYIFVSYKREDFPRVAPVIRNIIGWGYNIWYDQGIPGGSEWDAIIEEKVSRCIILIAFLSASAVDSKWVRREIKYADSLNKPILAIRLEEVQLKQGLSVTLSQYQMIDTTNADFSNELRRAISYVRLL
ncbi:MAG: toll/interleukin-1 receptor domain-containing protein [Syntrophomonadaceae bacterium]|nr:toll/interleukin-1 receptor domain-containing protein [Syntrophomonadaceae bacterium]